MSIHRIWDVLEVVVMEMRVPAQDDASGAMPKHFVRLSHSLLLILPAKPGYVEGREGRGCPDRSRPQRDATPDGASVGGENEEGPADIACFDDSVELADELIALVLRGQKRATAGSLAEYEKSPMLGSVRMELSPVFGEDRDVVVLGSDLFGNPVVESGGKKGVGGAKGSDG